MKSVIAVVIAIGLLVSAALPLHSERYALIVGHNSAGGSTGDLRYAESDAAGFAGVLKDFGNVKAGNIELLQHPDSAALMSAGDSIALRTAVVDSSQQTLFFFYYSGHADGEGLILGQSRFSFTALKKMVERITAGVRIAVFDACQSGVVVTLKGGARAEPFYFTELPQSLGDVWIASASASEKAQESSTLKSSIFTFHLCNGLRGSADLSADRRVTVTEAYQYAYRKTLETSALTSGIIQHPVYRFNLSGESDVTITDLTDSRGGIIVDGSCRGAFLVLSRDYTRVFADFYKDPRHENFIALAPGDYTMINAAGNSNVGIFEFSIRGHKTLRCSNDRFRTSLLTYYRNGAALQ